MEFKNRLQSVDKVVETEQEELQTRLKCAFPIIIKGLNARGEHYDELALVEDVGKRGLCFRATQSLIPGSIFTLYKTEEELDPVATFEVVWIKQFDGKIRKVGAQLLGENDPWLQYLIRDVVILPGAKLTRGRTSH